MSSTRKKEEVKKTKKKTDEDGFSDEELFDDPSFMETLDQLESLTPKRKAKVMQHVS